ncbi:DEAD/DEAH box helicase [Candidatus Sumerlaeota bacterium]|nr:DEAD/DEAH box helicase [Candidatus Sumerlaeota bacterium]
MSNTNLLENRVASAFYGRFPQLRDAQEAAIEPLLSGHNAVLTSGTGSGKTEAVMAPLVSKYWRHAVKNDILFLLYIAPTKALVNDIEKRLQPPLSTIGIRVGIRHGDRDDLISGSVPHVLITTPESLDVLLFRGEPALMSIRAVVIDEVHLLYNTQRGLQLSILLRRLHQIIPDGFQWVALSATIGDLAYVQDFLVGRHEEAILLEFSTTRKIDAQIRHIRRMGDLLSLVRSMTQGRKTKLLIFANSRRECEKIAGILQEDGVLRHCVFAHYSSLSPDVRVNTEQKFSSMDTAICVATSTLELGIDIGDIDAVLLWGCPGGADSFLQRIGRGNRRSIKTNVVCLIPDDSTSVIIDALRFAALIDAASKGDLSIKEPYDLFGAIAQQCLSIVASNGGQFMRIADLCKLFEHKSYFSRGILEQILAELASNGFLQRHGYKNRYGGDEDLYQLVDMRLIYGNFGIGSQTVDLFHRSKHLGEVPAINLIRVRNGVSVRFAGKCWSVAKISREGIHLEPLRSAFDVIDFTYGGSGISSDPHIADRIWQLIHSDHMNMDLFTRNLRCRILSFVEQIRRVCPMEKIFYVRSPEGICYYTFAGYIVNRAIGLFTRKPEFKANDISLLVPSPIDWVSIPSRTLDYEEIFHLLFEASSNQSLYQKQLPLDLQVHEYLQEWLKDKAISDILCRLSNAETVPMKDFDDL